MMNTTFLKLGFAVFATTLIAQAGPPLLCHPYDIGTAASLPWGSSARSDWDNPDTSYNTKQLSADTLKLLDAHTPVQVRMETLRRATIYGEKDHAAARELFAQLRTRAADSSNALAMFDYGYFVESVKEMQWRYKDDLTGAVDGTVYVNKALALLLSSPEIRVAADQIKAGRPQAGYARKY